VCSKGRGRGSGVVINTRYYSFADASDRPNRKQNRWDIELSNAIAKKSPLGESKTANTQDIGMKDIRKIKEKRE